jgi:ABC-type dipeptide/oligopeptide/nickel transport system permease subunit
MEVYMTPLTHFLFPLGLAAVSTFVTEATLKYAALALICVVWVSLARVIGHKTRQWRRYVAYTTP